MNEKTLKIAKQNLLAPTGLDEAGLQKAIAVIGGQGADGGDIYFQHMVSESWSLEDSIVKNGGFSVEQGASVRVIRGDKTGFAFSDEISSPMLDKMGKTARTIAAGAAGQSGDKPGNVRIYSTGDITPRYTAANPLSCDTGAKLRILQDIDTGARRADARVKQVMTSLQTSYKTVLVVRDDGALLADIRPLTRLSVSVIVAQKGRREQGQAGAGGRYAFSCFAERGIPEQLTQKAVAQALTNLEADDAPAGVMTVVLGPGWPGVLLHEAVGHGLEGDFNRKGTSAFSGRIGERVASAGVTVVDNGTLEDRRGSLNIDDEGVPTQCTTLIEDGILKGYMQDTMNARLMGTQSTGNGRRESYAHPTMPRMTNTYMLSGNYKPDEIITSVDKGLYAVNFGGGQVDITSGKFVFSTSEAYLIENGKITRPVKGASLIGNGPDVMTRVSMIGDDLALDDGIGTCGKHGQMVPVGVGQPTLRVDGITVGGTHVA